MTTTRYSCNVLNFAGVSGFTFTPLTTSYYSSLDIRGDAFYLGSAVIRYPSGAIANAVAAATGHTNVRDVRPNGLYRLRFYYGNDPLNWSEGLSSSNTVPFSTCVV